MSNYSEGYKPQSRPDKTVWEPVFAGALWVYGTIFLSWLLDFMPWRDWPFIPNFLTLTLIFWTIYQPQRIFYWLVFLFGLLVDTERAAIFGQTSLIFLITVFLAELMSQRLQWLSPIGQAINILPIVLIAPVMLVIESLFFGSMHVEWAWFSRALVGVVVWPLWAFILSRKFMPIRV